VVEAGVYKFNLTDGELQFSQGSATGTDGLNNINTVVLTATGGPTEANAFDVSSWSGNAALFGGSGFNQFFVADVTGLDQLIGGSGENSFDILGNSGVVIAQGGGISNTYNVSLEGAGSGATHIVGTGAVDDQLFVQGTSGVNDFGVSASAVSLANSSGTENVSYSAIGLLSVASV